MELILALLWTLTLIVDIISACTGNEPTWILVFCPLVILVMDRWEIYFKNRK